GPVWPTPTKKIPDPTLGVEAAAEMARSVPFPAVAIGGIDESRLPELAAAGLANFAVVRAVCAAPDPYARIVRLQDAFRRVRGQI
ncbi:MAG: thiamine phosphate synthase, partial [Kiritimatiellae bacterium]|nr:thiamine phosphate synthase [Kiritimatiellia bacterium]